MESRPAASSMNATAPFWWSCVACLKCAVTVPVPAAEWAAPAAHARHVLGQQAAVVMSRARCRCSLCQPGPRVGLDFQSSTCQPMDRRLPCCRRGAFQPPASCDRTVVSRPVACADSGAPPDRIIHHYNRDVDDIGLDSDQCMSPSAQVCASACSRTTPFRTLCAESISNSLPRGQRRRGRGARRQLLQMCRRHAHISRRARSTACGGLRLRSS